MPAQSLDASIVQTIEWHKLLSAWRIGSVESAKNSFIFPILQGPVGSFAELLPLASIMFVCRLSWGLSDGYYSQGCMQRGLLWPQGYLTTVWTFPLTFSSLIVLFYFTSWTPAISNNRHYYALQGTEQHSNEVLDQRNQPPVGYQLPVTFNSKIFCDWVVSTTWIWGPMDYQVKGDKLS